MKYKKTLLAIGSLASIATPVATVVACGSSSSEKTRHFDLLPTYTGQADQLVALGIDADYYPMQLNTQAPFSYLTSPGQFMTEQTDDFKAKFAAAVQSHMPKTQGVSWWNQDAKNSDDDRIDNTYWQKQEGSVLLYEHYLLDDDRKVVQSAWAPKHNSETALQTNFRASRDPYTRLPKGVFYGWDIAPKTIEKMVKGTALAPADLVSVAEDGITDSATKLTDAAINADKKSLDVTINKDTVTVSQSDAKLIKNLRNARRDFLKSDNTDGQGEWFYNDWYFVDSFHRNYLDNTQFQKSAFKDWIFDSLSKNPFASSADDATMGDAIKALFDASTFTENEVANGVNPVSRDGAKSPHHPIYEQQGGEIGAAPMFEGAMRDNQLYLYDLASKVSNLALYGTPYGKQHLDSLPDTVPSDSEDAKGFNKVAKSKAQAKKIQEWVATHVSEKQLIEMQAAFKNANAITEELHERLAKIKDYFSKIGVAGKTFGLLTIAPGHGVSTIQTMSKYSFIYEGLGLKQPVPANLAALKTGADAYNNAWTAKGTNSMLEDGSIKDSDSKEVKAAVGPGSMFNMDDNGWFWNIGTDLDEEAQPKLSAPALKQFEGDFDFGVIASQDENYDAEVKQNSAIKISLAKLFDKTATAATSDKIINAARSHADYNLWNEGLKTPFVLHMLLDQIITRAEAWATANGHASDVTANKTAKADAVSWGNYFTNTYVK